MISAVVPDEISKKHLKDKFTPSFRFKEDLEQGGTSQKPEKEPLPYRQPPTHTNHLEHRTLRKTTSHSQYGILKERVKTQ
jgi:hypothetical protein